MKKPNSNFTVEYSPTNIDDSGILSFYRNGGYIQTFLFSLGESLFKIEILSESHADQSYAQLLKWTDQSGFCLIINKNPKKQFNIDVSSKSNVDPNAFKPIIEDLVKIARNFA
jgi:hypothetical protein